MQRDDHIQKSFVHPEKCVIWPNIRLIKFLLSGSAWHATCHPIKQKPMSVLKRWT